MISSWTAYWLERFRPLLFVPAATVVAAAAHAGTGSGTDGWTIDIICALLLLGQFRLWDDLADRERDRAAHPSRVLVRATRVAPFIATCLVLAIVNIVFAGWLRGTAAAAAVVALDVAAAAWYTWRPARRSAATDLVLLTKYPAFVLLLAVGSTAPLPLVVFFAIAIYGLACAFEIWHDASGPLRAINS
jgi:4-hydroxybenzoate polyprenyltransferase